MRFSRLIWFVATAFGLLATICQAETHPRLNVLLITADDLGLQLGSYGETLIETPNFDALAASGAQFNIAYAAQASCSSSRSALFTGLFPHSTGQYGLADGGFSLLPELRDRTLPNLLKAAGYWTGIIGKLHVAPEESFRFDRREGAGRNVARIAQLAGHFMDEAGRAPFFLMVNYVDPHAFGDPNDPTRFPPQVEGVPEDPIPPGPETLFPFQQIDTPEQRARTAGFYNAVQRLDAGIGLLMDELDRRGHRDDTLVIFVSDQGPGFARSKTTVYEPGIRIPFLVRWPGVSKPTRSDALVSTVDVLPTILDALGLPEPWKLHGASLRRVLENASAPWRNYLMAEFHFHGPENFYPRRAIRDQRFKLIHNLLAGTGKPPTRIDGDNAYRVSQEPQYDGTLVRQAFDTFADPPQYELYDLQSDPIEYHNLASDPAYANVLQRMQRALREYRRDTDDPFLDPVFLKKYADGYRPPLPTEATGVKR